MRALPRFVTTSFVTKRGFGFIFAAIALFVIGDVTRTGWVQIADAVFWGAVLFSALIAPFASGGVTAIPRFSGRGRSDDGSLSQGDSVSVDVELINRRPWPRFGLTLAFNLYVNDVLVTKTAAERVRFHVSYLAPGATVTILGRFPLVRRGNHRLAEGVVMSDAPFGMFKRRQSQHHESSVLVYPAPVEVDLPASRLVQSGERPTPVTARSGEEVAGSRPYSTGDSARSIHWRNSARAGRLMTKAYSATEQAAPVLVIGRSAETEVAEAELSLDDRCRVATGVAFASGLHGVPLSMVVGRALPQMSWNELRAHVATLTSSAMAQLREELDSLQPGTSIAVILDVEDHEGVETVVASAPRMASTDVWLLSRPGEEFEWRASRVANALKSVGASVSVIERPLPALDVTS